MAMAPTAPMEPQGLWQMRKPQRADVEVRCPACEKLLLVGTLPKGTDIMLVCTRKRCPDRLRKEKIWIRVP